MSDALLLQLRIELRIELAPIVGATTKHRWVQTTVHVIPSCRSLNRRFGAQWTHTEEGLCEDDLLNDLEKLKGFKEKGFYAGT